MALGSRRVSRSWLLVLLLAPVPWIHAWLTHGGASKARGKLSEFAQKVKSLSCGDRLSPEDLGPTSMRRNARALLAGEGLGYCNRLRRVFDLKLMATDTLSHDGRRRNNWYNSAHQRAKAQDLPFDGTFLRAVVDGRLPDDFQGTPYEQPGGWTPGHGPAKMTLSLGRIDKAKGWVRGNLRFLPHDMAKKLQRFSDQEAYCILERLCGLRKLFPTQLITTDQHMSARRKVDNKRHYDGHKVAPCFTFECLLSKRKLLQHCVFSGIPLLYNPAQKGKSKLDVASFDRIDPQGDYTCENVQIVSLQVNSLKGDMNHSEIKLFLEAVDFLSTADFNATHVPALR